MRTGIATVQQTLTAEAAAVLKRAIGDAQRRGHAQVTPLHVAASLLSTPSSMLQQACIQSHRHMSHPLQCRALELCFNVALERLPAASAQGASGATVSSQQASLSNALVAALKRAQAHQRRGCPEQQQVPLLAVKVEMEQLVISILDDPSVSRVMREAGFSSTRAKNSLEEAAATAVAAGSHHRGTFLSNGEEMRLRLGFMSRPTPSSEREQLPQPQFGFGQQQAVSTISSVQQPNLRLPNVFGRAPEAGFESVVSREIEAALGVLTRRRKRNIVLIGEDACTSAVLKELVHRLERGSVEAEQLRGVKVVSPSRSGFGGAAKEETERGLMELLKAVEEAWCTGPGVVVFLGNLGWCLEQSGMQSHVMVELTRLLARSEQQSDGGNCRLWYIGVATSQTYMRLLAQHPSMQNSWGLQPLPISNASIRPRFSHAEKDEHSLLSVQGRLPKMPFKLLEDHGWDDFSCCTECTAKFEQESLVLQEHAGLSKSESVQSCSGESLPFWMKNNKHAKAVPTQPRPQTHECMELVRELRRKWSRMCHSLHSSTLKNCPSPLPNLLNDSTSSSSQTSSPDGKVQSARSTEVPRAGNGNANAKSCSSPWLSLSTMTDMTRNSALEAREEDTGLSLGLSAVSSVENRSTMKSSHSKVVTDLVLGVRGGGDEVDNMRIHQERVQDASGCTRTHANQSSSIAKAGTGLFQRSNGSNISVENEVSALKNLYKGLSERVPWQPEAVGSVASVVAQCRSGERRRRMSLSLRGDVWMLFTGADRMGKRKLAKALAELVFGLDDKLVLLSLSGQAPRKARRTVWNVDSQEVYRGKTVLDRLAEAVRLKPFSVVLLEDVDQADTSVRKALLRTMETGKLLDSSGREVSFANTIMIMTASLRKGSCSKSFQRIEDRLMSIEACGMRILADREGADIGVQCSRGGRVSLVDYKSSGEKEKAIVAEEFEFCAGDKRKARWSDTLGRILESRNKVVALDLNLGLSSSGWDESQADEQNKEGFAALGYGDLRMFDGVIAFKEFDFDWIAEFVMAKLENAATSQGVGLVVDVRVLEIMMAAIWEEPLGKERFERWVDRSIGDALSVLLARDKASPNTIVRLVADKKGAAGAAAFLATTNNLSLLGEIEVGPKD